MRKIYTTSTRVLAILFLLCGVALTSLAQPVITSVTPNTAAPGATITIVGTGFDATFANNTVYFGGVKATVTGGNAAFLAVTVPDGAQYANISVLNNTTLQTALQKGLFLPKYANNCYISGTSTFKPKLDQIITGLPSTLSNPKPRHAAIGDVDGDGKPDLIVCTYLSGVAGQGAVNIFLNTSTVPGVLSYNTTPYVCTASSGGVNVKLADLDGDGMLDIVVASSGSGRISCIRNTTTSGVLSFSAKTDINPGLGGCNEVAIADFDGDGKLDIASINNDSSHVQVFHNEMTSIPGGAFPAAFFGTFSGTTPYVAFAVGTGPRTSPSAAGTQPGTLATADFDGDGKFDIVSSNTNDGTISIIRNISSGSGNINFAPHNDFGSLFGGIVTEVQVAEINGDNLPDVIIGYLGSGFNVLQNSSIVGVMNFSQISYNAGGWAYALTSGDFDGDGKVDVALSKNSTSLMKIFRNTHAGVGGPITSASLTSGADYSLPGGADNQGITAGDIDLDGKPDIIVANAGALINSISIFENIASPDTSSLTSSADSVCVGATLTVNTTLPCAGETGFWITKFGRATVPAGSTGTSVVVTGVTAGVDTVIFKAHYLSDTNYVRFVVNVKALADTGNITGPTAVCAGSVITLNNATATGGVWSSSNTARATVSATGVVTGVSAGFAIISYTNSSFSCGSMSAQHTVTVNTTPNAGTITGADGNCVGNSVTLTAGTAGGTWINVNPSIGSLVFSGTSATVTGTAIGSDSILYIRTVGSCSDTAEKVLGFIAPSGTSPSLPIGGATAICTGSSDFVTNGLSGGSWSSVNPAVATIDPATGEVFGVSADTVTIRYTVSYGSCGTADTFGVITILPLPNPGTITGPNYMYLGYVTTLTTTGTGGTWSSTVPSVATVTAGGAVTAVSLGSTIISYSVSNSCGTLADTQRINVLPVPGAPTITSVTPTAGIPLVTTVIITGTGFDGTPANNAVYFGATRGNVIASTSTSMTVLLPNGGVYGSISYLNMVSLFATNQSGTFLPTYDNSCFIGGSATFRPRVDIAVPSPFVASGSSGPRHANFGDVDGDGLADLVVCTYNSDPAFLGYGAVNVYRNTSVAGVISYGAPVICTSSNGGVNVKLADLDGDGKLDIIVAASNSGVVSCLRNMSTGVGDVSFGTKLDIRPGSGPSEVAIADYDGDGKLDVAVVTGNHSNFKVFRNQLTGIPAAGFPLTTFGSTTQFDSFAIGSLPGSSGSIFTADFNNDGKFDIVTSNLLDDSVSVFRNISTSGTVNFAAHVDFATGGFPSEVQTMDVNGDNLPEIVVGNYADNTISILENNSVLSVLNFTENVYPIDGTPYSLGTGDIDGDGKVDIVVGKYQTDFIVVLRNTHAGGVGSALTAGSFTMGTGYALGADAEPQGLTVSDIDGDKKPDVAVANFVEGTVSIFKNKSIPLVNAIDGATDSVCVNSAITLHSAHCANSAGFWSSTTGRAIVVAGATDTTGIVTGITAGADTIVYTVVYLSDSNTVRFPISIKALADTGNITGPTAVCAGSVITLNNATATGGVWSSSNTARATVSATGVVTGVSAGFAIISYTNSSFSCGSMSAQHTVTVNTTPNAGTITGADGNCVGNSVTLTAGTAGGTWINVNPSIGSLVFSGTSATVTGTAVGSDSILYIRTVGSCSDTAEKVLGFIAPSGTSPSLPIGGATAICTGSSDFVTNGLSGGSWSSVNPAVATIDPATGEVFGVSADTVTIRYTVSYGGCGTADTFALITILPLPVPGTISGANLVYIGYVTTLTTTGTGGAWSSTVPSVATVTTGGVVTGLTLGSTIISYTVSNACGSLADTQIINVVPVPSAPTITAVTPTVGIPLVTTVTITGTGFDGTPANNAVYFGATRGNVIASSATSMTVTLPMGATYSNVSYLNMLSLLAVNDGSLFLPTYDNGCYLPGSATFRPRIDMVITSPYVVSGSSGPRHAAFGDVDGDGKPDLVVSTYNNDPGFPGLGAVNVYRNIGSAGTISYAPPVSFTSSNGGVSLKLADLDGDSKLDMIVACSGSGRISCLRNTSTGSGDINFSAKRDLNPGFGGVQQVAVFDFDNDGKLDIASVNTDTSRVQIFHNEMTAIPSGAFPATFFGTLSSFTSFPVFGGVGGPRSISAADFDNDGKIDIVTSSPVTSEVSILRNTSSGAGNINFAPSVEIASGGNLCAEVQAADINGDNLPEIVVGNNLSADVTVFENNSAPGTVNFTAHLYPVGGTPYSMGMGDIDGDNKVDIIIGQYQLDYITVLRNTHAGGVGSSLTAASFTVGASYTTAVDAEPQGLSVGDIDGDKKPDVAVANFEEGTVSIFKTISIPTVSAIAGSDSVCVTQTTNLHSPHCVGAAGFWSTITGRASVVAGATDTTGIVTGVTAGADTIVYTVVYLSDSNTVRFPISVKALADTGDITGASAVCVNATLTLSNTATGGVWSSSVPAVATVDAATGLVYAVSAGTTTIFYTAQSVSCGPLSASHVVTVNALPDAGTITASAAGVCVGTSLTLTSSVAGGNWVNANPAIVTLTPGSPATVTGAAVGNATILYIVNTASCGSDTTTQVVTVSSPTAANTPITGNNTLCQNDSSALANTSTGGTWSTSNNTVATVNAVTGVVYALSAGDDTVFYSAAYPCNTVDTFVVITVTPAPNAGIISGPDSVCSAASIALTTTGAGGTWTSASNAIATVNAAGNVFGAATTLSTTTISYTVNAGVCGSDTATHEVTVKPLPNAGVVSGVPSVCVGSTTTLSTTGAAGGVWSSSSTANATITNSGVVTGVLAGTAIISYTSSTFSCGSASDTILVTINATPDAGTISSPADSVCVGATVTLTTSGATGGAWHSRTGRTTVTAGGVVTGVTAGQDSIVYVSTTTSCGTDSTAYGIYVNPLPNAGVVSGVPSVCVGSTTSLSTTGAAGGVWSSSSTANATVTNSGVVTGVLAGTAIISYTSSTFSCGSVSDTILVTINATPDAGTISSPADSVCVGGSVALTTTGAAGGTWHSRTGRTTVTAGGVVTGVTAGQDSLVYVSTTTSCGTDSTAYGIYVNPLPNAGVVSGVPSVCVGSTTSLSTTGAAGGVWSSSSTANATVTNSGVVTGVLVGTAIISYTSSTFSCGSVSDTILVTINATPDAGTISSPADSVCVGATVALTTTGAAGGTWHSRTGRTTVTAGGVVTGVTAGQDSLVYVSTTTSCGTDSTAYGIYVNPLPNAGVVSGVPSVCVGSTTTLSTTGAAGGVWSSSSTANATVTNSGVVTGVLAGTAIISYTSSTFSCGSVSDTILVTINATPDAGTISSPADSVCVGGTVALTTTGAAGGTWHSRTGRTTVTAGGVVTGVTAGQDSLVYVSTTTSCGTDSAAYGIYVNPLPDAGTITGPNNLCATTSINLVASATGGTWSSESPAVATVDGTGQVDGLTGGSAVIVYTMGSFSCGIDTVQHPVFVNPQPNAGAITGATSVCVGFTTSLANTTAGGPGTWTIANSNATITTAGVVTGVQAGTDTVYYTYTNVCGTDVDSFEITINPLADADTITGANDSLCMGTTMALTDPVAGGVWSSTNTSIATIDASGVVFPVAPGTDTIRYIYSNICGSDTAIYPLTIIPIAAVSVIGGPDSVCVNSTIVLTNTTTGGVWTSTDTTIAKIDSVTGVVLGVAQGVVVMHYTFTNFCGVADTTDTVYVNPLPFADTISGGVDSVCIGTTLTLTDPAIGGVWSTSAPTVVTITSAGIATALSAGTAIISYAITNSCGTDYAVDTIVVNPTPALTSALTQTVCSGTPFIYTPTATPPGSAFSWTRAVVPNITNPAGAGVDGINETLISTDSVAVNVVYVYSISANGCSSTQNLTVQVNPTPTLSSDTILTVCSGSPLLYFATAATDLTVFAWTRPVVAGINPATAGGGTFVINETLFNIPGVAVIPVNYIFTLTANGCVNTQTVRVNVEPAPPTPPQITTKSPPYLCAGTMYQNFGAGVVPLPGTNYVWSSYNAQVWATGSTDQYCLVNFTNPGMSWVYLTSSLTGFTCTSRDSFAVIVSNDLSDHPEVWYFNTDFVCSPSDEDSYQWGYDDALTLDSTLLSGETNQHYYNAAPDFTGKFYWCITTRHGCMQKTYYKTPTGIKNVTNGGVTDVKIYPNPNNGIFSVNVTSDFTEQGVLTVTNILGQKVMEADMFTNRKIDLKLDNAAGGIYFVTVNTPHGKFTGKVTITGND